MGTSGQARSAALLVLLGMAIIGLIDSFVVNIAEYAGLWQFHATRAAMALPILIGVGLMLGAKILPLRAWAVFGRAAFIATAMILYFGSIPSVGLPLTAAGLFTSPVFVLLFSALFFGHRVGPYRILAVFLGFAGVLLILDPFGADFTWRLTLPVLAGAFYAMSAITAREWCAGESVVAMMIGFFLVLGSAGLAGVLAVGSGVGDDFFSKGWKPLTGPFLFWTAVQAVGSLIAVSLLTRAYQSTRASYLVVFENTLLVFAAFWSFVLFGETVSGQAAIGMGLIVASSILISLRTPQ